MVLLRAVVSVIIVFLSLWCALEVSCAQGDTLLPEGSEMPGWGMVDRPYEYSPPDLWKYINGEAESFLAYGFVSLKGANYSSESEPGYSIGVDIYDLGNKLNAFGVYQSRRGDEPSSSVAGAASFGAEGYLVFYKDRYYVEILSFGEGKEKRTEHLTLGRMVAEKMPGDVSPPHELSYLSSMGRIEGTERYVKGGILGHAFLDRGVLCHHKTEDGNVVSAFVAFFPSVQAAESSLEKHKDFLRAAGEEWTPLKGFKEPGFASQEPHHQAVVVVQKGAFLVGVYDLSKAEKGTALLKDMLIKIAAGNELK